MNKRIFLFLILCCVMAGASPLLAQKSKKAPPKKNKQKIELKAPKEGQKGSKKQDISYYFDDGGIANPRNIVKFNPILLYTGDAPLYYERRLARFASIEVGAGLQLPYWKRDLYDVISGSENGERISPPPTSGYSIYANPRIYLGGNGLQGSYVGFSYRQRNLKLTPDDRLFFTDYAVNYGAQGVIWGHFSIEYNLGVGMRSYKQTYQGNIVNTGQNPSRRILPCHIKIGYVF